MLSATMHRFCSAVQLRRLQVLLTSAPRPQAPVRSVVGPFPACEGRVTMPSSPVMDDIWHYAARDSNVMPRPRLR